MEQITLEDLLEQDLLAIDKDIHTFPVTSDQIQEFTGGGVYAFIDGDNQVLYVGITDNIYRRISSHLNGYGSRDIYEYNHNKLSIAFFQEANVLYRDIYESYLIYRFNPRYNISKTAKHKR